ncbi:hypothetical protein [Actinomadura fibrosa]|uniref:Uncharacterized protein n=1 Tax=Actinomadura fibrosa TaxID=111802 RepID=A0ABW2Y110_9ACTN|nr:hypothetical protein [Actinomadura fibrosa]
MGIDVTLMKLTHQGTSPRHRQLEQAGPPVHDDHDTWARLVTRTHHIDGLPMLKRIDPYRDLLLTSVEMPQLLEELTALRPLAQTPAEHEILTRIERLAAECQSDPRLELHLTGD